MADKSQDEPASGGKEAAASDAKSDKSGAAEADPPRPAAQAPRSVARRRQRNRLVILLGVALTGLVGAIWASVSGSLVHQGEEYVAVALDKFRRGEEIRALQDQVKRLADERDKAVADAGMARVAYVTFAFRDRAFCFDAVRAWARDAGHPFTVEGGRTPSSGA